MGWFRSRHDGARSAPTFEERLAQIRPGVPGRCPSCDGLGYIEDSDIGHRYQIQHCTVCKHRWEYLFDAEGVVVELTELDEAGQPVARSRVRPLRAAADVADAPADAGPEGPDAVIDLRDPVPPAVPRSETEQLTPAEWIRRSVRR